MELPTNYSKLSPSERRAVRNEYVAQQGGLCHYCGMLLSEQPSTRVLALPVSSDLFPPTFFKHPVHLHHDHTTDKTIGAVHARCNAILWEYHGE